MSDASAFHMNAMIFMSALDLMVERVFISLSLKV